MKAVKLCLAFLCGVTAINFIRSGDDFPIARVLPFCGGDPVDIYDGAGLILLGMLLWGIMRLKRR